MKRVIALSLSIVLVILLSSCSVFNIMKTESDTDTVNIPEYLSDYDAQYNENDEQLQITFGFKDQKGHYITSKGTAKIVIIDKTGNKLFSDTISFNEKDFSEYTSKLWKGTRNLCGIYINSKKIEPAASDEGKIKLTVNALNNLIKFDTQNIEIMDLPIKDIDIKTSKLPIKVSYFDFNSKETVLSITDVSVKSDIILDDASATVKLTVKMINNNLDSDYGSFTIKGVLKNSKNVIVASEEDYGDNISNGESVILELDFYELDPNEAYTLSFKTVDESFD